MCKLVKETKNLVNKVHKLIIKELKLNVNHNIKINEKIRTFFKSNNAEENIK